MTGQQLRNSILQEAIQGRLVPNVLQPGEKTCVELLQDILAERQNKENEEKGKKARKLTLSTIEEEPWELPEGWCWCKLGDLFYKITDGTHSTPKYTLSGVPFISVKDISKGSISFANTKFISETEHRELIKRCGPERGDLLLTKVGTTGIPVIVDTDREFSLFVSVALCKHIKGYYSLKYILHAINSPFIQSKIAEDTIGAANKNWVIDKIFNTEIPLPPLSIQKAIVEKIEFLFPLVDEYDKAAGELETLNKILPDKLRKSVLQEAIHGNLVPNEIPEGEATAQELLQQILKERQDRENKEKGKKAKKLTLSAIEEEPWELPKGWCWCRGKDIFFPMESVKPKSDFIYIDTDAVNNKKNIIDNPKNVLLKDSPSRATRKLHTNDILFSMVRPYLKNIAYVDECFSTAIGTTGFYVITTSSSIYQPYLFKLMLSDYVVSGLTEFMKGDNSPSINNAHIEDFIYPLPPLSIQKAIVAKIEEVFSEIDKLQS